MHPSTSAPTRTLRLVHFSPWADALQDSQAYLEGLPKKDLRPFVANAADADLLRAARLDCDWYGESTRAFAAMQSPSLVFLSAFVTGAPGLAQLAEQPATAGEERWLVFDGQTPQRLAPIAARLLPVLKRNQIRIAWYAFDEASRTATVFRTFAPYLDVLVHDEAPLDPAGQAALSPRCVVRHRSWVANVIPFSSPFNEAPEERILFLGSKLGLTDHRKRQIAFLQDTFRDRFVAIHDHSVAVADRAQLNRFKVGVCPEGRKFGTPAMSQSHTDRPFWSGCLGLVPVSENSRAGNRLDALAAEKLILRYEHADLKSLREACEHALAAANEERRRLYEHFNRHETVGAVLAEALCAARAEA
ncbi:hypothetical protein DB347_23400 [Opitutaceae bacterium EW11]|nr:hypothetical protein DB347_23400 [Opitutaceae bacterium EW11]